MNNRHPRQNVPVTYEMLGHAGAVAPRDAVAPDPSGFQVSRRNGKNVLVPVTCGKALPRMGGIIGRMRPAVHPDRSFRGHPGYMRVPSKLPLRSRIEVSPHLKI